MLKWFYTGIQIHRVTFFPVELKSQAREGIDVPESGGLLGGQYQPLSRASIERIHQASLEIFDEVGFEVYYDGALEVFAQSGARVDFESRRVRLSPKM
jgi:trimethylamine:corrinoid methyltransferase-like protein